MFVNVNYHNILKKLSKNLFNGLKWGFSNSAYRKGVAKVLLSTINYKTPPAHSCNVVFNSKSPLGDTKPNNFRPIFFVLR